MIGTIHKVWFVVHSTLNSTLLSGGSPLSYVVNGNIAYYDIKRKAKKFNVYVVRCKEGNANFQESQPCKSCQDSLKNIGFKKIYYSTIDGRIEKKKISCLKTEHISKAQKIVKENTKKQGNRKKNGRK